MSDQILITEHEKKDVENFFHSCFVVEFGDKITNYMLGEREMTLDITIFAKNQEI